MNPIKATPAARKAAREAKIDLALIEGRGPLGRIHKADVLAQKDSKKLRISPLARKIAEHNQLDLAQIHGSGHLGKIMKEDVLKHLARPSIEPELPRAKVKAKSNEEIIPMSPMRQIIAERMKESYLEAPSFTLNYEADMSKMIELRSSLLPSFLEETGLKLSLNDLIALAVVKTLKKHPLLNSRLSADGKEIIVSKNVNLGMAVGVENGLLVPVVKEADQLSLKDFVIKLKELIKTTLALKTKPEDLAGSSFTISNLGMFGCKSFNPIINKGNSAILGVSATKEQVVARAGEMVILPLMNLSLTVDHRVLDGVSGAKFMQDLVGIIEDPFRILI